MTEIRIAKTKNDIDTIAQLASAIWHEHYTPIIGIDQVKYMLDKFQSTKAIGKQIEQGYLYFSIYHKGNSVGYLSVKKNGSELFLSKIYVSKDFRGHGIGKTAMFFIEQEAISKECNSIILTVNKYNTNSIKAYEKIGFINTGVKVLDIGNGYIMDDYTMEKPV